MTIEVRVPCSTSNLGAGFDCIGLAFARYLTVRYTPGDGPLRVERSGTVSHVSEAVDDDAVVVAMRAAFRGTAPGGLIEMHSDIPVGRGLGSSAAATAAGISIAHVLLHATGESRSGGGSAGRDAGSSNISSFDRSRALAQATEIEGHPDNAAPSLMGGLVAVARSADHEPHAFKLPLSPSIGFVFAAPDTGVSTTEARAALPATVTHPLATRMLGRMAALVRGLECGDTELLRFGLYDELHVPWRLPLIPGGATAIEAALSAGAWGATISGSGSGVIALAPMDARDAVAASMRDVFERFSSGATSFVLMPDNFGLQIRLDATESWR